jgi:hypothetical protein
MLTFLPGLGKDPDGIWPPEISILILGLSLEAGKTLAQKYRQNAFVWCSRDRVPELILLR